MPSHDNSVANLYDFEAPRGRPTKREQSHRNALSGPEDTSYSEEKFYVASVNEHDHDESMRIRMPKWMMVYMQDLVRDPRLPAYRSVADVLRDALAHRVHYIHENGLTDSDTDWIEREILRGSMARIASRRADKIENVQSVITTITEAQQSHDPDELNAALEVAANMANHIGEPYASDIRVKIGQVYTDAQNYRNVPDEVLFPD